MAKRSFPLKVKGAPVADNRDSPDPFSNILLNALAPDDLEALRPHLVRTALPTVKSLEVPRRRIGAAYFVEEGIVSVVDLGPKSTQVEVGIIGWEGVTGVPLLLGNDRWQYSTYMQVGGWGYAIDATALRQCLAASPAMAVVFLRFVQAFLVQISSTSTSRARGKLDERLSRWLLMAHDRTDGDELTLTHEFLAMMLAVRRPGVTVTLSMLVSRGLIRTGRGVIRVIDRKGLEKCAGVFYGSAEAEYQRLFESA